MVGHGPTHYFSLKSARHETESDDRGQRRSHRATDGARSVSHLPLRLCESLLFPDKILTMCSLVFPNDRSTRMSILLNF